MPSSIDGGGGVLIFKGMRLGFLAGDLEINFLEGSLKAIPSLSYDTTVMWLDIARQNLEIAKKSNTDLVSKWNEDRQISRDIILSEVGSVMTVYIACSVVLDALYDRIKRYNAIILENDTWKKNRTARYAIVSHAISRAYRLNNNVSRDFRKCIKHILDLRDKCLHPDHRLSHAVRRPEFPVGLDWRFCTYTYANGLVGFSNTVNMLLLLHEKKSVSKSINDDMSFIVNELIDIGIAKRNDISNSSSA